MGLLNREDILKVEDVQTRAVEVPEWGGTVLVRGLDGTNRDDYQASMMQVGPGGQMEPDLGNMTAKLVARAIVDEDGVAMFNALDVGRLGQKSGAALARVYDVAMELSGMTAETAAKAKANLELAQSGDSTSS
jgi:hypothetical protein